MKLAHVILDIPTQALDAPYTYAVPEEGAVRRRMRRSGRRRGAPMRSAITPWLARPCWCRSVTGGPSGSWWTFANTASRAGLIGRPRWTRRSSRPSCAPSADRISTRKAPRARSGFPSATSRRFPRACACSRRPAAWRAWCAAAMVAGGSNSLPWARWTIAGWCRGRRWPRFHRARTRKQSAGGRALRGGELRVNELAAQFGAVIVGTGRLRPKTWCAWCAAARMRTACRNAASRPVTDCNRQHVPSAKPALTAGQAAALSAIERVRCRAAARGAGGPALRAPAKTEVYLQAIERVLAQGSHRVRACARDLADAADGGALPQTLRRDGGRHAFAHVGRRALRPVISSARARRAWWWARAAPCSRRFANIGLIVIDEEHEGS